MCGIFFSLSSLDFCNPDENTKKLIQKRGPDSFQTHRACLPSPAGDGQSLYLTFTSSVLALRGDNVQVQPLVDPESQSILCWNGEAWKISDGILQGNDSSQVFQLFLQAVKPSTTFSNTLSNEGKASKISREESLSQLSRAISSLSGPFSFVFFDGYSSRIIYGRDFLGRRSILHGWDNSGNFNISSVCDGGQTSCFEEVEANGIHIIDTTKDDLSTNGSKDQVQFPITINTVPWAFDGQSSAPGFNLIAPIPPLNKSTPTTRNPPRLSLESQSIITLEQMLRRSLELRLQTIPDISHSSLHEAKVAILFSGGLDCTILARLAHDILPENEPIDLLNVAFENPRVVAAAATNGKPNKSTTSAYEECPDRKTGISSFSELQRICPTRRWRFVRVDIPYVETLEHRDQIKRLMFPHNTEMDLSIACALYFAARGKGNVTDETNSACRIPYLTTARVLLSGLGADEVFAGYSRHNVAFSRDGYKGLIDEIELDVGRLGKRNLGRDDRVISHWGREVRYPFLDEDFLAWTLQCPVWEKCGFRNPPQADDAEDEGQAIDDTMPSLEPNKQALRLLAWKLDMRDVSKEKKRAIQFGSRTAKMESGRSKGHQTLLP